MGSCFKQLLTKRNFYSAFQQTNRGVGNNIIFFKKIKAPKPKFQVQNFNNSNS
jgi:hypothetical protein